MGKEIDIDEADNVNNDGSVEMMNKVTSGDTNNSTSVKTDDKEQHPDDKVVKVGVAVLEVEGKAPGKNSGEDGSNNGVEAPPPTRLLRNFVLPRVSTPGAVSVDTLGNDSPQGPNNQQNNNNRLQQDSHIIDDEEKDAELPEVEAFKVPHIGEAMVITDESKKQKRMARLVMMIGFIVVITIALLVGVGAGGRGTDGPIQTLRDVGDRTLQIIHSNENESGFQDVITLEEKVLHYSSIVEGIRMLNADASIHVATGDMVAPGAFYYASSEVESLGSNGMGDIAMFNAMSLDATGIGNHDVASGIIDFATFVATARFPYVNVNLNFTGAIIPDGVPPIEVGKDASPCTEMAAKVVRSCFLETEIGPVGLIGRISENLFKTIEDPETRLPGVDYYGGRDPESNSQLLDSDKQIQEQVKLLESKGIDIIILLDQSFNSFNEIGEPVLSEELNGIDVLIGEFYVGESVFALNENFGPFNLLRDGDVPNIGYPLVRTDSSGHRVLLVNTGDLFR